MAEVDYGAGPYGGYGGNSGFSPDFGMGGGQNKQKPKGGGMGLDYMQMIAMIGDYASKNNAQSGYALGQGGEGNFWNEGAQKAQDFGDPVGAAIAGYLGGKKDKKLRKKIKKRIEMQRNAQRSIFSKGLSQQEAMQRLATQQALGGFETAKRAAQMSATGAKRSALDREKQIAGAVSQGLVNSGLGGTSVGANLRSGVAAGTNRELSNIDEQLGQYFGQLAMGRAGIEAGGTMALSDLANQRTGFNMQDAGFWMPYDFGKLGMMDARMQGGIRSTGSSIPMQMFGGGGMGGR